MTDIEARFERVKAIATGPGYGQVVERNGDTVVVEIAADASIGLNALWGESQFVPIFRGQTTKLAPRRIAAANGGTIVCHGHEVTTSFYIFEIDLAPRAEAAATAPSPGAIMQPTKPYGL